MEDAIFSFKCAGIILIGMLAVMGVFGRWIKIIPFGSAAAAFGFLLCILHIILGFFYWIEASHLSAGTVSILKNIVLGVIFLALLVLVCWAKMSED